MTHLHHTYLDLVVLADGHGADAVLLAEVLAQRRAHDASAQVGGGVEVRLAVLPSRGRHQFVHLCHFEAVV